MTTGSDQFDQIYLSCNAMSALPLLPPFEKKTVKPSEFIDEISNSSIYLYGFPAKVTKSEINDDGIYMRLIATEGTKNVAMCEYYYSWENKTFSYREVVVPSSIHLDLETTSSRSKCTMYQFPNPKAKYTSMPG